MRRWVLPDLTIEFFDAGRPAVGLRQVSAEGPGSRAELEVHTEWRSEDGAFGGDCVDEHAERPSKPPDSRSRRCRRRTWRSCVRRSSVQSARLGCGDGIRDARDRVALSRVGPSSGCATGRPRHDRGRRRLEETRRSVGRGSHRAARIHRGGGWSPGGLDSFHRPGQGKRRPSHGPLLPSVGNPGRKGQRHGGLRSPSRGPRSRRARE